MTIERYELLPAEGVSREIGFYLSGMNEVSEQVRKAVQEMSDEEIERLAFEGAHPIGALVLHIGEAEWWWMQCNVAGHELDEEARRTAHWDVLLDSENFAARGYSAQYCLNAVAQIRSKTKELLATLQDTDLERIYSFQRKGEVTEASLRRILHHLIDHEAQHKGQILMLKRLLGENGGVSFAENGGTKS